MKTLPLLLAGISAFAAIPARAQTPPAQSATDGMATEAEAADIIVTGARIPGQVIGTIPPEVTLTPGDIRSFGVTSLSDLVTELAAQTGSGQGRGGERPVVLLNGGRVSSFTEVRDIPTEAIARVEILPEEVALKYGYRANQKVMNIVLRRRFKAVSVELEGSAATQGGQWGAEVETSFFRVGEKGRLNLAFDYERSSPIYEAERGILQETPRVPAAIGGNLTALAAGDEIDPALSLLAGRGVTVAGVPALALTRAPALADFATAAVNTTDIGAFRTLRAQTDTAKVNLVYARPLSPRVSMTLNASLDYSESKGARGLATAALALPASSPWSPFASDTILYRSLGEFGVLDDQSQDWTAHAGTTLAGNLGDWTWTFTGNYDHAETRGFSLNGYDLTTLQTRIAAREAGLNPYAALAPDGADRAFVNRTRSRADTGSGQMVVTGPAFALPAGKAMLTVTGGVNVTGLTSRSDRSGTVTVADLSRTAGIAQASLDLPLASRREGVLAALGDLSVNVNAGYDHYSDAGGLRTIGAGLNWTPIKPVSLVASWSRDDGAASMQQRGNPLTSISGVRVYDYVTGETVDVTRVSGGNPLLTIDDRRVIKLGLTVKPFAKDDLSFTANYTDNQISDPIASFPAATAAIQAAFPARFTRDANGRLIAVDTRPINFDSQRQREIRWGLNFSKQLSAPPRRPDGQPSGQPGPSGRTPQGEQPNLRDLVPGGGRGPGAGTGGPGGGFGRFGGGPGGRGTRMQVAVYHTVRLEDRIAIAAGVPVLDLLRGDAIGGAGGVSRHEVRVQGGLMHNGLGIRLSGVWQSGTTVESGADVLRFSGQAKINLRLFANLGLQRNLVQKMPFLRGSRISIGIDNLFDSQQRVRDSAGLTPLSFQPGYLDPLGRSISLSFRKLFF